MTRRTYPLELLLTAHGTAELLNANDEPLWTSDADDVFRENVSGEFLDEDDLHEILSYLFDHSVINEKEFDFFDSGHWKYAIEVLDQDADGTPGDAPIDDDDDENEENDDDDDDDDDDEY